MLSCTCQKDCLTLFSSQCIILIELKLWEVISSMIRQVYCVWHMKEVVPNFQLRLVFLMCEAFSPCLAEQQRFSAEVGIFLVGIFFVAAANSSTVLHYLDSNFLATGVDYPMSKNFLSGKRYCSWLKLVGISFTL